MVKIYLGPLILHETTVSVSPPDLENVTAFFMLARQTMKLIVHCQEVAWLFDHRQ
jgi:hypothetical protein